MSGTSHSTGICSQQQDDTHISSTTSTLHKAIYYTKYHHHMKILYHYKNKQHIPNERTYIHHVSKK